MSLFQSSKTTSTSPSSGHSSSIPTTLEVPKDNKSCLTGLQISDEDLQTIQRAYGQHVFSGFAQSSTQVVEDDLDEIALQLIEDQQIRTHVTPSMPAVLPKILSCFRDESTPNQTYIDLIGQDPLLAASVLKSANSIVYNPKGKTIDSFERALVLLGSRGLKMLVSTNMAQAIAHSAKSPIIKNTIWPYTLRVALLMSDFAEISHKDTFNEYLAGLFHSIGDITFIEQLSLHDSLNYESYRYLVQRYIEQLSLYILTDWAISDAIMDNIVIGVSSKDKNKGMSNSMVKACALSKLIDIIEEGAISDDAACELCSKLNISTTYLDSINQTAISMILS